MARRPARSRWTCQPLLPPGLWDEAAPCHLERSPGRAEGSKGTRRTREMGEDVKGKQRKPEPHLMRQGAGTCTEEEVIRLRVPAPLPTT